MTSPPGTTVVVGGIPVGVQLIARPNEDEALLGARPHCRVVRPLIHFHNGFANILGVSISEVTMRPNPRRCSPLRGSWSP